jgi:predicted negative regulator of RcsB-dependent stress response
VDEALYIDSTYADAYYLRAAVYVEQNKVNFALEDFELAYALDPHLFRAKLNIAVLLIDAGQYQNALELLTELKTEPIDFIGEVLYYSGEALYMLHDMEGACDEWREATSQGDKDAESNFKKICLDKSGKVRFKKRNYAQF